MVKTVWVLSATTDDGSGVAAVFDHKPTAAEEHKAARAYGAPQEAWYTVKEHEVIGE